MKTSISSKMMSALERAKKRLATETREGLVSFLLSQQRGNGGFPNKGGLEDLYYTAFGWLVSYVLGIRLEADKMNAYLGQFKEEELDFVHYIAFMKCKMLHRLVSEGIMGMWLNGWKASNVRSLDSFLEFPHEDRHSPYNQFLWLSLLEDCHFRLMGKKQTLIDLQNYRVAGGGFSNLKQQEAASANATAAALMIKAQLAVYDRLDAEALCKMQEDNGGFKAEEGAPIPDLLSTATALFALKNYGLKPLYNPAGFIEAHLADNGGFMATLLDEQCDVEYVFYGLLALGSI